MNWLLGSLGLSSRTHSTPSIPGKQISTSATSGFNPGNRSTALSASANRPQISMPPASSRVSDSIFLSEWSSSIRATRSGWAESSGLIAWWPRPQTFPFDTACFRGSANSISRIHWKSYRPGDWHDEGDASSFAGAAADFQDSADLFQTVPHVLKPPAGSRPRDRIATLLRFRIYSFSVVLH